MPVNRCILGEMLQADFEDSWRAAVESMRKRKPSALQLKQRSLIQKDWNDYMGSFQKIRRDATDCDVEEYAFYKMRVKNHHALATAKFGVAL